MSLIQSFSTSKISSAAMSTGTSPGFHLLDFSFRVNFKTRAVIVSNLCRRLNLLQSVTALTAELEDARSDEQGRFDAS